MTRIEQDAAQSDHYYAFVDNYLDFERPVPFRVFGGTYERRLTKADGSTNRGLFGVNVRRLADHEFDAICQAAFNEGLRNEQPEPSPMERGLLEAGARFERPIIETLVARPFRDAAFSKLVREAYGHTCAFTGIRLINGGGRSEVQSAHIRPVHKEGPDTIRNGLALSGTVHWMFDRGLISVADDLSILVTSRGLPNNVRRMFHLDGKIKAPAWTSYRPARDFLDFHRKEVFKP